MQSLTSLPSSCAQFIITGLDTGQRYHLQISSVHWNWPHWWIVLSHTIWKINTTLLLIRTGCSFLIRSHLFIKEPNLTCTHCNSTLTILTYLRRVFNFFQEAILDIPLNYLLQHHQTPHSPTVLLPGDARVILWYVIIWDPLIEGWWGGIDVWSLRVVWFPVSRWISGFGGNNLIRGRRRSYRYILTPEIHYS